MPQSITWLLPVKNAMPYLTEALASIESQSHHHWEVLAWDNGSTDGSVQELRRWIPERLPGRVIADKPMGLGACLAKMVEQANTPLCVRMDSDDVNLPDRLEKQVTFLADHPCVAVVGTDIQFIDEHGKDKPGAWSVATNDADIRWRLRFCNAMNHPTVLFRRSAVLAVGNYRNIKPGQDYDLWLRLAERFRLANLPDRLVRYRQHPTSIGSTYAGLSASIVHRIACSNGDILFPGVPSQEAIRLRDLVSPENNQAVRLRDVWQFHKLAIIAAKAAGERSGYFRRTAQYRWQAKGLWIRWFKRQPGAATIWPVLGKAWRGLAGSRQVGGLSHELG